jgi:hypothetical protein
MENKIEIWKNVVNYEGLYQVSNLGRVRSLHFGKEKLLKNSLSPIGYYRVSLNKNGKTYTRNIHLLVAECFLNHKTDGTVRLVVDHINKIKTDNYITNLRVITNRENCSNRIKEYTSKYTGVCFWKKRKVWKATIQINKKMINIGCYKTEIEAHLAYQYKLKQII